MNVGPTELLILLASLLLLFGAARLPRLARSLGQAGRELKEGMREGAEEEVAGECPFCGGHVPKDAKFCPGCSKKGSEIIAERAKRSHHS